MANLADSIVIELAGEEITLRPALRHAIRLDRRIGSFPALAREVLDGSLSAALDIIEPHYCHPMIEHRVLEALPAIQGALFRYVLACSGVDPDEPANDNAKAKKADKPVPYREYLAGLYRIATGWLSWPPEVALDATPAEITEAHKGRVEMLNAIFGGGSGGKPEKTSTPFTDQNVKAFFAARKKEV